MQDDPSLSENGVETRKIERLKRIDQNVLFWQADLNQAQLLKIAVKAVSFGIDSYRVEFVQFAAPIV